MYVERKLAVNMITLRMFFCIIFALMLSLAQLGFADKNQSDSNDNQGNDTIESHNKHELGFFRKLFFEQRKKHLSAVKNIKNIKLYEQRYKMIFVIIDEIINVIESKKSIIERAHDELKKNSILSLSDGNITNALLSVSETTALFGDILLENPNITHRILKKKLSWYETLKWSLTTVNTNPLLIDQSTIAMLKLVFQELNLIERTPEYSNPNWNENLEKLSKQNLVDSNEIQRKNKKTKRKHGPQIVHIDL